ncbi:FliM/FliN family flagellar motor switch protein [Azospirillum rugosum]|uniref:Flagellar motor switch protein FliM n=1 Tax=Azospirillum rugosum TaxID=416170 RepID=A0ABS4SIL9_9PROT|nr:FliM/FliN family flagellar motor switch protein [Azospirillum rugosum]MBP2292409.1 flagellar motor switch protein FliM [Azospirillum rugosum]MDQ0526168.1 flagellar motor switch protein FliM [Azospirillum rugosum]
MGGANGASENRVSEDTVWAWLADVPAARLVRWLEPQAPQTVAALLLLLPPDRAAELLSGLSDEMRARALRGMAVTRPAEPEALAMLERVLRADLLDRPEPVGGDRTAEVARIIGHLPPDQRDSAAAALQSQVPPPPPVAPGPVSGSDAAPVLPPLAPGLAAMLNTREVRVDRLPMLEVVMDRFVRLLSSSLRPNSGQAGGGLAEVGLEALRSVRFGDWMNATDALLLAVFRAEPWDGYALLVLHGDLLDSLVEIGLGGSPEAAGLRLARRQPNSLDRAFAEAFVRAALGELAVAFEPIGTVAFPLDRLEDSSRHACITRPHNACFVADLVLTAPCRAGRFELLIPYGTLEPVRAALGRMFMGERFGRDPRWEAHLRAEVARAAVRVQAVAGTADVPLGELLSWRPGAVVRFDDQPGDKVALTVDGLVVARGVLGQQGTRWAVGIGVGSPSLAAVPLPDIGSEVGPEPSPAGRGALPFQDIPVRVSVVVGAADLSLAAVQELTAGGTIALDREVGDPVDLIAEDRVVARGERVVRSGRVAVRLTAVLPAGAAPSPV